MTLFSAFTLGDKIHAAEATGSSHVIAICGQVARIGTESFTTEKANNTPRLYCRKCSSIAAKRVSTEA